jgi:hypothetical protein
MREECSPNPRRGDRNVFCSDYNYCLDYAITRSWNSWNCCKCKIRFGQDVEKESPSTSSEVILEYELTDQSISLDWDLPDYDFNGEFDVATL